MGRGYDTISFLSDYGTDDEFAGVVKAVVRDLAPHVAMIDLTHAIAPHDVRAGALALVRCIQYLPAGVVLAVVDPGVGTERRAVAIEVQGGEGVLVGPDNGLLAPAVAMAGGAGRAVELTNPDYQLPAPGATFAGRDVFAPAAAHLCLGVDLAELGEAVDPGRLLPGLVPLARPEGDLIVTEVLWVDRYGNAQLNVGPDDVEALGDPVRVITRDPMGRESLRTGHRARTYAELGTGQLGLVVDSYGLLSLSLDRASAADEVGLVAGDQVRLGAIADDDGGGEGGVRGGVSSPVALRSRPSPR